MFVAWARAAQKKMNKNTRHLRDTGQTSQVLFLYIGPMRVCPQMEIVVATHRFRTISTKPRSSSHSGHSWGSV